MKALVLVGKEVHVGRLIDGLGSIGCQVFGSRGPLVPTEHFDMIFVDQSYDFPLPKLNYDYLFLFDCEDDPFHFKPGSAYYDLKDKVHAYAKLVYRNFHGRPDNLKQIAFPIDHFLKMAEVARTQNFKATINTPFFVGVPTFIGRMVPKPGVQYGFDKNLGINSIGWNLEDGPHYMYNQRVEWLLSLYKSDLKYHGGLVFGPSNQALDWQTKYFGNVSLFKAEPIPRNSFMTQMGSHKIALLPTGYDRIGWRVYDAMALGNVMMMTDIEDRKMLILPKEYMLVSDGEDIAHVIDGMMPAIDDIYRHHEVNKKYMASLTPEIITKLFFEQLEK
jgi:hypothetical protein